MPLFSIIQVLISPVVLRITKDLEITLDSSLAPSPNPMQIQEALRFLNELKRIHRDTHVRLLIMTKRIQANIGGHLGTKSPSAFLWHKDTFFPLNLTVNINLTNYGFRTTQGRNSQQGHLCLFDHRAKLCYLTNQPGKSH